MKRISSIWIAVLGVAVGALAVLAYDSYSQKKNLIRVQYGDWRKLNLILDQIDRNYVDTINVNDVTEAAITAALAELDPHSVYMPPVELTEAETDLAGNFDGIGIQFNVPNDTAIVLEVIPGGPSEKVGLQKGDRIAQGRGKGHRRCEIPAGQHGAQDERPGRHQGHRHRRKRQ